MKRSDRGDRKRLRSHQLRHSDASNIESNKKIKFLYFEHTTHLLHKKTSVGRSRVIVEYRFAAVKTNIYSKTGLAKYLPPCSKIFAFAIITSWRALCNARS